MRVSDQQRHHAFSRDIEQRMVNLTRIQRELGTGYSVLSPSEDPNRAHTGLRAEELLAQNAQFLRNRTDAIGWIEAGSAALQSVLDLVDEIDRIALAANNDSQTAEDRNNAAIDLNSKIEELMTRINARHGDRHLFAGHATTNAPYTINRDVDGRIIGATAASPSIVGEIYRRVGNDEDVRINLTGAQLFQPVGSDGTDPDLFYVITTLRDTIGNNNTPPPGYEETRSNVYLREQLGLIRERLVTGQTYLGSVHQRLDEAEGRMRDAEIRLTDLSESAIGIEMTSLVSRLATEESAYNALLSISSRLMQQSLVDFIR